MHLQTVDFLLQLSKTVPTARAVNILFEDGKQTSDKQSCHTMDASKMVEMQLKETLVGLVHKLFGEGRSGN